MQSRNWIPVMPLAILFVLQATASYGQEAIGKATSKETVRIRTGDTGHANLQYHNDIKLSVGPKSSVDLDKYVYDPNKSAGTIAVQAERGSLRFVRDRKGVGRIKSKLRMGRLGIA